MNKHVRRGTKIMRVVVTSTEKKLADEELKRPIKELDRERLILVSMEQIARGQRLFAARSNEMEARMESEEMIRKWWRGAGQEKLKLNLYLGLGSTFHTRLTWPNPSSFNKNAR